MKIKKFRIIGDLPRNENKENMRSPLHIKIPDVKVIRKPVAGKTRKMMRSRHWSRNLKSATANNRISQEIIVTSPKKFKIY